MDAEQANYIISFYSSLLTVQEKAALKHYRSTLKLEDELNGSARETVYFEAGWLSRDPAIVDLLQGGYETFVFNCAKRIIKDFPEQVQFNICPRCGKLARTPQAKQCRHCHCDWH